MITATVHDDVATLTIDRREIHNALDAATLRELDEALDALASRDDVAAIVITGAGDRAFVAGGDLTELAQPAGVREALRLPMQQVFDRLARFPKPSIAAVNGAALGGGLELALACDIRICVETATFGLPELGWSLLPAAGGITRLVRTVGGGRARELILTGRRFDAAEAIRIGIVTHVVGSDDLLSTAHETARLIGSKAPLAVQVARLVTDVAGEGSREASLIAETLASAALHGTSDRDEGRRAFVEKRAPRFGGK
ncbi:enoyl-CoA hydratase/isomerase family protein [Microbacterium chocolatum]|uniref:enoyl-CoA hydratase/isomerase family protein n=1 Tax=Microbacterium aurantiacum TaxID=162393 RepID=UPI00338EC0B3